MSDPVFQMCVPRSARSIRRFTAELLEEGMDMPVPGLVHRYRPCAVDRDDDVLDVRRHCTAASRNPREQHLQPPADQVVEYGRNIRKSAM
jgi:L-lysine 2,3-aminomutase